MLEIYAKAASYYHSMLKDSKINTKAMSFLETRNIGEKAINDFIIGFAPNRFNLLYNELSKDFSTDLLEKVGLIFRSKNGNWVDRFRNRIIIPIQNENGEIIAFGARALENKQIPKYLNSPSSTIYNKSKILYALNFAKEAIKKEDSVLIMEGYFDVITAHMNGIKNAVATCGTALTSEQVKLLSKYTKSNRFLLSFDSDAAGINAAKRAGKITKEVFTHLGNNAGSSLYEVRVLTIPDNKDPDEYIRTHGRDQYLKCISNAPFLIDFLFDNVLKTKIEIKTPQDKVHFALQIFEIICDIDNKIVQFEYVKKLAKILELNESIILYELEKYIKVHLEDIKTRCKKTFN
jgi:DNA primase